MGYWHYLMPPQNSVLPIYIAVFRGQVLDFHGCKSVIGIQLGIHYGIHDF